MIGLAMYLSLDDTDESPAWFFWAEGILAVLFFLYEGMRTYSFEKSTHVEEEEEQEEVLMQADQEDTQAMLTAEPQARFYIPDRQD